MPGTPSDIAIAPDGSRAYVSKQTDHTVSVIDVHTDTFVGGPIQVPGHSFPIASNADGSRIYIASLDGVVGVIDAHSNQRLPDLPISGSARAIALSSDGGSIYFSEEQDGTLTILDARTGQPRGAPIPVGQGANNLAVVPDQPPTAAFSVARARPGVPVKLDASSSKDPDSAIATYAWQFGDGQAASLTAPNARHTYAKPGTYNTILSLADAEGCSTTFVFTGKTASCNGSAAASRTLKVIVAYPGVAVRCPRSAGHAGCRVSLRAIDRRPSGRHRPKPESAPAHAKVKAGHSAIVSLIPAKKFRASLASASNVLVRESLKIGNRNTTRIAKLKIVQ
jgi:DNA-binding beta-propeller fold protein YncE